MAFGSKQSDQLAAQVAALTEENANLRAWVTHLRGQETPALEAELRSLTEYVASTRRQAEAAHAELSEVQAQIDAARRELVATNEVLALQELGIYEFAHPLDNAVAYKARLDTLRAKIKAAAPTAVDARVEWAVNGSTAAGAKLGKDLAKLMLRAYNNEADTLVRAVKPSNLPATTDRLSKARDTISRLGTSMHISLAPAYHQLRLSEIRLTADYRARVEEEKEAARAERERLREEEKARREFEREKERLAKERMHYVTVAAKLVEQGATAEELAATQAKLDQLDAAIAGVEEREANIRTGWVYVISNVGAFGEDIVKIGMTRRLDPQDRIDELGDASVPFRFDVHAQIFSPDAVTLETQLHQRFADRRVNLINARREFFYVTPHEVRQVLVDLVPSQLLEFTEEPDAQEWRMSDPSRREATEVVTVGAAS